MNIGVAVALLLLLGLLTLVSYVDRVYQEIGKFLSREFQDNIDVFEQKVEPNLGVSRTRASLSRLGLLAEDYDPAEPRMWGNFPQTYSMVGLINSAIRLSMRWNQAF